MQFTRFSTLLDIPQLNHAITHRQDGVSQAPFSSLNLGLHVDDNAENVRQNRQIVARELGYTAEHCTFAQQTHGTNAQAVTPENRGRGAQNFADAIPDCDALIVGIKNAPAMILVADCAPILIVDPQGQVLATVHAGWRGALGGIAGKTVAKMRDEFGCNPQDLRVGIGPCLCANCLEIGEEVASQVLADVAVSASTCIVREGFIKPHLNLRQMICNNLIRLQVLADNIEVLDVCPQCSRETYFSHRGDKGTSGRFGLMAWWSEVKI